MALEELYLQNKVVIYLIHLKLLKDQLAKLFRVNLVIKIHIINNFQKLILQHLIVLQGMVGWI